MRLSLRQCLHLALEHNIDLEIARYQPWIEEQNILSAQGAFDHTLYWSASGGESVRKSTNPFDPADIDVHSATSTAGVRRLLPFGLSYDLYFRTDRLNTNQFFASAIQPQWDESLALSLTLPALKGRGEDAQYSAVVIARHTRQAAVERFEKTLIDQLAAVQQAYWDLVFARENLELRRQSEKVAEQLLKENRTKFERGVLARVDVTEAEAGLAAQQESIITAENAVQNAADRLKQMIDPDLLKREAPLVPSDAPRPFDRELDERKTLETSVAEALVERPDYRELASQIAAQDQSILKAANDLLPKFDLVGTGTLSGLDDSFVDANDELRTLDSNGWTIGFSFEWPLEGRAAKGALRRAELERRRLDLQRRSLEDAILMEIRTAVREIKTTEKRIEASRRARALAQERFEGEMSRREAGLRTTFHVLEAERSLTQERTNQLKAVIDYNVALMNLEKATGTLPQRYGIVVEDSLTPRLKGIK
ncbi:MAG: TolC family protein [Planctomycetes bacterium]|nr:TolC family protein [Planctomycetota bacterium]